jgi:hypothetical protein
MWYRLAQERDFFTSGKEWKSEVKKEVDGTSLTFYSPIRYIDKNKTKFDPRFDVFRMYLEYPNVRILFKYPKDYGPLDTPYAHPLEFNISQSEINEILKKVLNVLSKYNKGFFKNNTTINIVSQIHPDKASGFDPAAFAYIGGSTVYSEKDAIAQALDHEIGHLLTDFLPKDLKEEKMMIEGSPSIYGEKNWKEAYAEAYQLLMIKGYNFRFEETSQNNIKQNKLLDYVRTKINPSDFKNLQFTEPLKSGKFFFNENLYDSLSDYNAARHTALVGAFQNAIDKFKGDKNSYAKSLLSNKQKINEIVKYVNGLMMFINNPANQKEIDLAVKTIGISSDKKPNPNSFNINGTRFNKILEKDASTSVSKFYLPKAIKDFIDINIGMAKYYEPITLLDSLIQPKPSLATITRFEDTQLNYLEKEPKNFGEFWDPRYSINKIPKNKLSKIPQVSVFDQLVPVDELEYKVGQSIINAISSKDNNYLNDSFEIEYLTNNLIKQIFPPLTYNNPEEYLYYDFHLDSSGDYSLDTNAVEQKINNAINTSEFTKKMNDAQKKKIAYELRTRINRVKNSHTNILNKTIEEGDIFGDSSLFPGGKFRNIGSSINVAKQAVDKLFTAKIPRRNLLFMRIYNNTGISEKQKQELLNYYKSKQIK